MQIKIYRVLAGLLLVFVPLISQAQKSNSLNTFSPYTFYGIGEILPVGSSATRSMGGIGVAYASPFEINYVNPAANSTVYPQSAALSIGMTGRSHYLKTKDSKTSYNSFNFNDVGLLLPVFRRAGLSVSVTPFSSVGYDTEIEQHKQPGNDDDLIIDVGHVLHKYTGDGNINQLKLGFGIEVFKDLSIGASFVTYLGTISKYNKTVITPAIAAESYRSVSGSMKEEVADISFDLGIQYRAIRDAKHSLVIGAVYQPDVKLKNKMSHQVITYDTNNSSAVTDTAWRQKMTLPQKIGIGAYYQNVKLGVGLDYTCQDWSKAYKVLDEKNDVSYRKSQTVALGMHYTPNRNDIRRILNRWTYRAGFRYSTLSVVKDGYKMEEMAVTFGLGVPIRSGNPSEMSIGVELGRRGKTGWTDKGYPTVRDNFFRVSVGFSLFDNTWFMKYKYD